MESSIRDIFFFKLNWGLEHDNTLFEYLMTRSYIPNIDWGPYHSSTHGLLLRESAISIPFGKLTWLWKIVFFAEKSTVNCHFQQLCNKWPEGTGPPGGPTSENPQGVGPLPAKELYLKQGLVLSFGERVAGIGFLKWGYPKMDWGKIHV